MKIIGLFGLFITTSLGVAAMDYNAWVKHFYQTQDVSSFDGYWQMVLHAKMLENRNQVNPVLGFASQVFHGHPSLIRGRIDDPASFPEAERGAVLELLWLSNTEEAREVLRRAGAEDLAQHGLRLGETMVDEAAVLPDAAATKEDLRAAVRKALESLEPRMRTIIERRFGFPADGESCTPGNNRRRSLRAVGRAVRLSGERIRQVEREALKTLKQIVAREGKGIVSRPRPQRSSPVKSSVLKGSPIAAAYVENSV